MPHDAALDHDGEAQQRPLVHVLADPRAFRLPVVGTEGEMVEQVRARPKPPTCCWVTQIDGPRRVRLPADALVRALPARLSRSTDYYCTCKIVVSAG